MNVLILAGFLGSGKTTLLLATVRELVRRRPRRIAIIENDSGKVGIDSQFLREEGLSVKDLPAGCICCQLRTDLVTTLLALEREQQPELVIIEPSGTAGPHQVASALIGYGGNVARCQVVVVADGVRFQLIQVLALPFVTASLEAADIVAISKLDRVQPPDAWKVIAEAAAKANPRARIVPLSAATGENVSVLVDHLEAAFAAAPLPAPPPAAPLQPAVRKPEATVFAAERDLAFPGGLPSDAFAVRASAGLRELTAALQAAGCRLIGHIKLIARHPQAGYLFFSVTQFGAEPESKGRLAARFDSLHVTLNVIVYGVPEARVRELAEPLLDRLAAGHAADQCRPVADGDAAAPR